ncbi:hypothetical protein [Cryptosporangium sp. NPDC051539]|uniref:hypothetical protein n=1 Tax=Cryptosporangium sp. NPDC051539 TaxID=3363962 RepID=UPI0037AE3AA3
MTQQLLSLAITLPADLEPDFAVDVARMSGRLGFSAVHLCSVDGGEQLERLAEAAAPALVVVDPDFPSDEIVRVNDPAAVVAARAEMNAADVRRPLLVAVPISIGRTTSEAIARADLEPRFTGDRHPRQVGIFGTFEQAQDQVLALSRAGADGLVLDVPLVRDVADVLAQIRALVVGATPRLVDAPTVRSVPPPRTVFYGE